MTTCGLTAIAELAAANLPDGWRIGLFGSASRCAGNGMCITQASDIDLLLVHPRRAEEAASTLRRRLMTDIAAHGAVPDISVLSQPELESTGFWKAEGVVDLTQFTATCADAT